MASLDDLDVKVSVVLLAGGQGTRMCSPIPKQFLPFQGKAMALHSFELFASVPEVREIIVVCEPDYRNLFSTAPPLPLHFALPGTRRQDSVFNGFQLANKDVDLICIHDSARPLLSRKNLEKLFREAKFHGAAALAVPVKNTIIESDPHAFIKRTLDRSVLWEMHTPQVATPELLKKGFEIAHASHLTVTDDAAIVSLAGHPVKLVPDAYSNIKITTQEDWPLAEALDRIP